MEAKESSILDAAETIFAQVGLDGAKVSNIARAGRLRGHGIPLLQKQAGPVSRGRGSLLDPTDAAEAAIVPMRRLEKLEQFFAATTSTRYWTNSKSSR